MKPVRIGVVGVGHLGQHHARILGSLPGVELVGVADTRPEQAGAVASRHGTRAFSDYRELLDEVDAVTVAVPTCRHHEVAGAFLDRCIPVMVEKPLAADLAEAEALVELAQVRGIPLQVGHVERFNPALSALAGLRPRPKFIAAERLGLPTFRSTDIGVVLDLMIHDIDLVLTLVAEPVRSVTALGVSLFGGHEDVATARVEFTGGCVVNLTASRASVQASRKMRVWAAEGYATLDFAARQGTVVRPSDRLRRGELDLEDLDPTQPAALKERVFGQVLRIDHVNNPGDGPDPLTLELQDFVTAVTRGTRPRVTGSDALRALRLADQILQSINTHEWEGHPEGPVGPRDLPAPRAEPIAGLPGPHAWRIKAGQPRGATEGNPGQ